jgi:shikimate kinase
MSHIILIGFMGSGKSTVGKLLAEKSGLPFIDSDTWIEQQSGKSILEIFETEGETAFRIKERAFCEHLKNEPSSVIATGGGLPCYFDNLEVLKALGEVVYLNVSLQTLTQRLKVEREKRPLLSSLADTEIFGYIEEKITNRKAFYKKAHQIFPNESNSMKLVVENLMKLIVE